MFTHFIVRVRLPLLIGALLLPSCTRRSEAAQVPSGDAFAVPSLSAPYRTGKVTIDGHLDEVIWSRAGRTGPFVDPGSGRRVANSPVAADARFAWDEAYFYFAFTVHDANPTSPFTRQSVDPHVWEHSSAIELMIQPGDPQDNKEYYELQIDVAGAVWDTRFDDYNAPITGGPDARSKRYGHQEWQSGVQRAVNVRPGLYVIEASLPWRALESARTAVPPKAGDAWRMNFYSFRDGQRHALAWSAIHGLGNFHRSSRFGRVTFRK